MSSNATMRKMNRSLYAASFHLLEASRHLSNVAEFRPAAFELFEKSQFLADIIEIESDKISDDKISSILDEIFSIDNEQPVKEDPIK